MLKKPSELQVPKETPFANDALKREEAIKKLTRLIQSTEQPFVLSVEAPWGWGKTTFVRMWRSFLESKGHTCFYFNAWENDFVDDPLVAFLGQMKVVVEKEFKESNKDEPTKKHWSDVKRIGAGVLRKTLPLAIQVATQGLLTQDKITDVVGALAEKSDKIGEFASTLAKERLEKYESERNGVEGFRASLGKLAEALASKEGHVSPLVFFIDEMDRCRPDFAITLLERIKHLFNVNRVVFVLAVDRAQINESVKALYGLNANADGYLRRFIDLAYSLPAPSTESFVMGLCKHFAIEEVIQGDKARIWRTAFVHYAGALSLSLRAQEQCFTEMNIVWRTNKGLVEQYAPILSLFSAIRAYRPGIIQELNQGQISIETVMSWFKKVDESWYLTWVESALIHAFTEGEEHKRMLAQFKAKYVNESNLGDNTTARTADYLGREDHSYRILALLSELEMTTEFN